MKGTRSFFLSVLAGVLFGLWWAGLWILSSLPGEDVQLPPFPGADKLAHLLYFALGGCSFAWLLARLFGWRSWKLVGAVLVGMMLLGALDEFHQLHTVGRSGADWFDWMADSAGGFLGALVIGWMYVRRKDRTPRGEGGVVAQGD